MPNRNFVPVEKVAWMIVKLTKPDNPQELLEMIPEDLSQTMITDLNIEKIIAAIDQIRYGKEDGLAQMMGLGINWENIQQKKEKLRAVLVDSSTAILSPEKEDIKRQIRFLRNLCRSISELKFVRQ